MGSFLRGFDWGNVRQLEVLRLYVDGRSYQEIAERLSRHVKSIDNALQRIKRKLEGHLQARSIADAG